MVWMIKFIIYLQKLECWGSVALRRWKLDCPFVFHPHCSKQCGTKMRISTVQIEWRVIQLGGERVGCWCWVVRQTLSKRKAFPSFAVCDTSFWEIKSLITPCFWLNQLVQAGTMGSFVTEFVNQASLSSRGGGATQTFAWHLLSAVSSVSAVSAPSVIAL
jgi:hypothetical protein